jgi:roadblock/LC7 domain-containing protein
MIVLLVIALVIGGNTITRAKAAATATPVEATVLFGGSGAIETRMRKRFARPDREYGEPIVLYEYVWQEQVHQSRQFTIGPTRMRVGQAERIASNFPTGSKIKVLRLANGTTILGRYQSPSAFLVMMVPGLLIVGESLLRTYKKKLRARQARDHAVARTIAVLLHIPAGLAYAALTDRAMLDWIPLVAWMVVGIAYVVLVAHSWRAFWRLGCEEDDGTLARSPRSPLV